MPWELPRDLDTPALVVDIDVLEANVGAMATDLAARHIALRPHVKTHKSVEIARRQRAAGATGLTVATIGEAEVFADAGFDDLFIAYPIVAGGPKADRLRALLGRAHLRVGVDSRRAAAMLGRALGPHSGLAARIELDSGQHRSGVAPAEAAVVAQACADAGIEVEGVFTHPGHAYGGPGAVAGAAEDEARVLAAGAAALAQAGFDARVRSGGSTPTVRRHLPLTDPGPRSPRARAPVVEQRPGSYVFNDRIQVALGSCTPEGVSLVVAATVVSTAQPGRFVVDAGSKALSSDRVDFLPGFGVVVGAAGRGAAGAAAEPDGPDAVVVRLSEHHGVVETARRRPDIGDVVAVVPNHVCPVVDHFDHYVVVRDGVVVDRWPVDARGRLT
jgi:D-serine deaminase-like pyridoxal phosphate-dependent protein